MAWSNSRKYAVVKRKSTYRQPAGSQLVKRSPSGKYSKVVRRVPKFINPFARDEMKVQLTYRQTISLNPTTTGLGAGGSNSWTFSLNTLYDPDVTGTGNQPQFFDNYSAIYDKYKVSFAKVKATVVNHSVNTAVWNGSAVVAQPNYSYKLAMVRDINADTDYPANMNELLSQNAKNCRWRYVAPQLNGRLPQLTLKCAPHKTAGVSYDDDTLTALTSAPPQRNVKAALFITSADGQTDPPSVYVDVEIVYYVKFFDKKMNQPVN